MRHIQRELLLLICLTVLFASFVGAQEKRSSDLLLIRVNEKAGFIDRNGKIIVEPQFEDAQDFSQGIAPVKIKDKWGFINESGQIVIEPTFDSIFWRSFSEEVIPVRLEDKWGTIDKSGNFIIEPKFEMIYEFSDGIAPVLLESKTNESGDKPFYLQKWSYIDKSGKQVIDKEFYGADGFVDGRAFVKVGFDEWALIDKTGTEVTKKHFDSFDSYGMFSEGLVAVKVKKKYGFIDRNGKFVIKPQFDYADNFSEGLASVRIGCNYGFINTKGKIVIQPQYSSAGKFSDGLASVALAKGNGITVKSKGKNYQLCTFRDSGLMGYIDKTGKIVIEPQFGRGFDFSNGIAEVSFGEPNDVIGYIGKRGYIDKTGKYIWQPTK